MGKDIRFEEEETVSIGAEVTSAGRLFQRRLPVTGNARSPTVDSRVCPITSCEDDDVND